VNGRTTKLLRRVALLRWLQGNRDPRTYRRGVTLLKRGWLRRERSARAWLRLELKELCR